MGEGRGKVFGADLLRQFIDGRSLDNSALIDVPLTFLEHAEPPKRKARYTVALCAQISLNTLQTKSEVFEITVFPKTKDVEIE